MISVQIRTYVCLLQIYRCARVSFPPISSFSRLIHQPDGLYPFLRQTEGGRLGLTREQIRQGAGGGGGGGTTRGTKRQPEASVPEDEGES